MHGTEAMFPAMKLEELEPLVGEWATAIELPGAGGAIRVPTGAWEIRHDGEKWAHDFALTYTRLR